MLRSRPSFRSVFPLTQRFQFPHRTARTATEAGMGAAWPTSSDGGRQALDQRLSELIEAEEEEVEPDKSPVAAIIKGYGAARSPTTDRKRYRHGTGAKMTETSTLEAELEQVREGLRTVDLETARTEIGKASAGVIHRYEVGHTTDSTNAEFIGATFSLLASEAIARLLTLAESGDLDSPEAEAMVSGVGGCTGRGAAVLRAARHGRCSPIHRSRDGCARPLGSKPGWTCSASRQ